MTVYRIKYQTRLMRLNEKLPWDNNEIFILCDDTTIEPIEELKAQLKNHNFCDFRVIELEPKCKVNVIARTK